LPRSRTPAADLRSECSSPTEYSSGRRSTAAIAAPAARLAVWALASQGPVARVALAGAFGGWDALPEEVGSGGPVGSGPSETAATSALVFAGAATASAWLRPACFPAPEMGQAQPRPGMGSIRRSFPAASSPALFL